MLDHQRKANWVGAGPIGQELRAGFTIGLAAKSLIGMAIRWAALTAALFVLDRTESHSRRADLAQKVNKWLAKPYQDWQRNDEASQRTHF
jgi:hypothetical protein